MLNVGDIVCIMTDNYSQLDREIVTLAAVWELIDSMVNYSLFEKPHEIREAVFRFHSSESRSIFLIILADFLSLPRHGTFGRVKPNFKGSRGETYLGLLQGVVTDPQFNANTAHLELAVEAFAEWLDGCAVVERIWLPAIERDGPLQVRRMDYLKMCGTISKHGFTRLGNIASQIRAILSENGTTVDEGQAYRTIPDFREWFMNDVFIASSTRIAWHLNEIRWGIYYYLSDEYQRAFRPTSIVSQAQFYTYEIPPEIENPLIRAIYWDLMNGVRSPPYFSRFTVNQYFNDLY